MSAVSGVTFGVSSPAFDACEMFCVLFDEIAAVMVGGFFLVAKGCDLEFRCLLNEDESTASRHRTQA